MAAPQKQSALKPEVRSRRLIAGRQQSLLLAGITTSALLLALVPFCCCDQGLGSKPLRKERVCLLFPGPSPSRLRVRTGTRAGTWSRTCERARFSGFPQRLLLSDTALNYFSREWCRPQWAGPADINEQSRKPLTAVPTRQSELSNPSSETPLPRWL